MKIHSTRAIHAQKQFVCVYGASGTGKTSLVKTLDGPTLILNAESGLGVLTGTDIDYISVATGDKGELLSYPERFAKLKDFMAFVQTDECKKKYKYLFIDSLTEVSQIIEKAIATQHKGWEMWAEYKTAMIDFLKFFRDARVYDVVFTSLEDRRDEDAASYYAPNVGGKSVKEVLLSLFDEVYRLVIIEGKRTLVTQPTAKSQAKTRCRLITATEPADLGLAFKKIRTIEGEKK